MRDYLLDIVKNTVPLGPETIVRISGNDKQTEVKGRTENNSIVLRGVFKKPVKEFRGVFGLSKLPMLSGLLNLGTFKGKDSDVTMKREKRNDLELPVEIQFSSPEGTASYRLTHEAAIPKQYQDVELDFTVEVVQPEKKKVSEFSQIASIYAGVEDSFSVKTEDGSLVFMVGREESSSHKASFVFADNVKGKITSGYYWNVNTFLTVLKLMDGAETSIKFNNEFIQVELNTGIADYQIILPGSN